VLRRKVMGKEIINKLVRDRIPTIIEEKGKIANCRLLDDKEYEQALLDKLIEESNEVKKAVKRDEVIEELGDVMTVIMHIARIHDIVLDDIVDAANEKAEEKGVFLGRCFLESIESKEKK